MEPLSRGIELHAFLASALVIQLGLLLLTGLLALGLRRRVRDPLGLARGGRPPWQIAVLVATTLALSHGVDSILAWSGTRSESALAELSALLDGLRGGDLALAVLGLGIVPGIAEELLCRGALLRGLAALVGRATALLGSALFFAALHLEPVHAGFALLLGLHLGGVALVTGSTRAAIVCHVANNVLAVVSAAWGLEATGGASALTGSLALLLATGGWALVLSRSRQLPPTGDRAASVLQRRPGSDDR